MHIMTPKSRAYYDLEAFWSNGALVPLEGVLKPNAPTQQQQQEKAAVVEEVVSQLNQQCGCLLCRMYALPVCAVV